MREGEGGVGSGDGGGREWEWSDGGRRVREEGKSERGGWCGVV